MARAHEHRRHPPASAESTRAALLAAIETQIAGRPQRDDAPAPGRGLRLDRRAGPGPRGERERLSRGEERPAAGAPRRRQTRAAGPSSTIRPPSMTATRSAAPPHGRQVVRDRAGRPARRARAARPAAPCTCARDRGVERRDRLVEHEQPRARARGRGRWRRAGARPPRARPGGAGGVGRRQADRPRAARRRAGGARGRAPAREPRENALDLEGLGDRAPDTEPRVETEVWVLEDDLDRSARAADGPRRPASTTVGARRAAPRPPAGAARPTISRASVLLPQPDSPTSATTSPASTVEVDSVERRARAACPAARRVRERRGRGPRGAGALIDRRRGRWRPPRGA